MCGAHCPPHLPWRDCREAGVAEELHQGSPGDTLAHPEDQGWGAVGQVQTTGVQARGTAAHSLYHTGVLIAHTLK